MPALVLVLAVDDVDDSLKAAELVRHHFPDVTIVARARDRFHAYKLHALGVDQVIRETFESAEDIVLPDERVGGDLEVGETAQ